MDALRALYPKSNDDDHEDIDLENADTHQKYLAAMKELKATDLMHLRRFEVLHMAIAVTRPGADADAIGVFKAALGLFSLMKGHKDDDSMPSTFDLYEAVSKGPFALVDAAAKLYIEVIGEGPNYVVRGATERLLKAIETAKNVTGEDAHTVINAYTQLHSAIKLAVLVCDDEEQKIRRKVETAAAELYTILKKAGIDAIDHLYGDLVIKIAQARPDWYRDEVLRKTVCMIPSRFCDRVHLGCLLHHLADVRMDTELAKWAHEAAETMKQWIATQTRETGTVLLLLVIDSVLEQAAKTLEAPAKTLEAPAKTLEAPAKTLEAPAKRASRAKHAKPAKRTAADH